MVVCRDASVLAQLGTPDMRVPIAYGFVLSAAHRVRRCATELRWTLRDLSFEPADLRRVFPALFAVVGRPALRQRAAPPC
jgi:1-deoxy-D-xylulose-5-phosphate reductoisomerase